MMPDIVIIGGEEYSVDICNTYLYAKLKIKVNSDKTPVITLTANGNITDVTQYCKKIRIIDYESYRRIQREIFVTVSRGELYGRYRTRTNRETEKQYLKTICDMLKIPFEYESKEDDLHQTTQEKAQRNKK